MSGEENVRKPFGRLAQKLSANRSIESGALSSTNVASEDVPVVGGRGRMFASLQKTEQREVSTSSSGVAMGRGKFLSLCQTAGRGTDSPVNFSGESSTDKTKWPSSGDQQQRSFSADVSQPQVSGRGKFFNLLRTPAENPPCEVPAVPAVPVTAGRGKFLADMINPVAGPSIVNIPSSDIMSTTDALAQMRIKHREESSRSSESKMSLLQQCEADAAQFEEFRSEESAEAKSGTVGVAISALTNYIRLETEENKGVFDYEVRFNPPVHSMQLRYKLMGQQQNVIGPVRTFDGVKLNLPIQLPDRVTQVVGINPNDNSQVEIFIIYKGRKKFSECQQLYGILFSNIMKILKFVRFGYKDFDPTAPKVIPQHKLEIWPGYVTSVEECHGGVLLCVDVTHRVLRQTAVIEIFQHAYRTARGNNNDFKTKVTQALLGSVVLTRYNNRSYRIDDIDWDKTPNDSFETKTGPITYVQYYKQQYNIDIKDLKQPLLISREDKRVSGQTEKVTFTYFIIPEIAFLTGLTDEQRADFKVMKDVATFTRISPSQRAHELVAFCKRVNSEPKTRELLANWGLRLMDNAVEVKARLLNEEEVVFGNNKTFRVGPNADFGKYCTNNELLKVVPLHTWILIHVKTDQRAAKAFMEGMERNLRPMGISVNKPKVIVLDDDKTDTFAKILRQALNVETQIVVIICPSARDDRYSTIKKLCCAETPIPSQVINARTLGNEAKNRSIIQKIALQMNCKMGGSLWNMKIPMANVMIIGIDTYHDKKSLSVTSLVASTNDKFTEWYSKAVVQNRNEEIVHGLVVSFEKALRYYQKINSMLPKKIIIFRDGVGDGQLKTVKDFELQQLKQACNLISEDYNPPFTCVVVQKRINARFYATVNGKVDNPLPGTVVDHTITRSHLYDFYLVPQCVRQGTVTPTHCVVIEDNSEFKPDHLQRLTYKMCFLYYNWPGTVRVPACCQYAHKLAFLVGNSMKREPAEVLNNKLFYL